MGFPGSSGLVREALGIEQLLARQLLDAQRSSLPRSEGPETQNLLTFLLTPKAAGRKTSVTGGILGFYNQSLLSSRSMVRIHQGAFQSGLSFSAKKPCCNRVSGCQALPSPARPCLSHASGPRMGCFAPWRGPACPSTRGAEEVGGRSRSSGVGAHLTPHTVAAVRASFFMVFW